MDTGGLLLRVVVLSAGVQDWDGLVDLGAVTASACPQVRMGWVDQGFAGGVRDVREHFGWELVVVRKDPGQRGFAVQPRRWVVERTFAWLGDCRRLAKDLERYAETSEAFIYLAMIHLMLRRLAPATTPSPWRTAIAA